MRYFVKVARAIAQAGVAGLAIAALLFAADGARGDGPVKTASRSAPTVSASNHLELRLAANEPLPQTRRVSIGHNKSMLISLHRELRDVVVSAPDIMDAVVQSSDRVYLIGKKIGQSNAFLFDQRGELILTLEVMVDHDTEALDLLLGRLLPGSQIKTEILNETVILTGTVRSPIDATRAGDIASRFIVGAASASDDRHKNKVINMLGVEGEEQVMLRVTVAEVQRSVMKQLGINVGAIVNSGNFSTTLLTENALPLTAARGLGLLPVPGVPTTGDQAGSLKLYNTGPNGANAPFGNSGLAGGWSSGGNQVAGAIRALERDGLLKTLAEPNLTAVSGETAKFLAGGEFPVPVVDTQGALSVMFKEFGVGLSFTPMVLSEGRISLKIETEVSELTSQGAVTLNNIQIPALKKRQAKSTVELPSGGSLALAGLISDDVRQNIDGFPGLKNVPVLGTLFRSRDYIKEETELVVIVTPYMVKPVARQKLVRPDEGLAPATDMKATFLGHLNRIYGRGQPLPDGSLKGDYGFIVE